MTPGRRSRSRRSNCLACGCRRLVCRTHSGTTATSTTRPPSISTPSGVGTPNWACRGGCDVPQGAAWPHGRKLFTKRLMGVSPDAFAPAAAPADIVVRVAVPDDLDDVLAVDTIAFEESAEVERPWLQLLMAHPSVTTAVAELDGGIVATGSVTRSEGRAGPAGYVAGIAVLPPGAPSWHRRRHLVVAHSRRVRRRRGPVSSASGHGCSGCDLSSARICRSGWSRHLCRDLMRR